MFLRLFNFISNSMIYNENKRNKEQDTDMILQIFPVEYDLILDKTITFALVIISAYGNGKSRIHFQG